MDHISTSIRFIEASAFWIALGVAAGFAVNDLVHIAVKRIKRWFDE